MNRRKAPERGENWRNLRPGLTRFRASHGLRRGLQSTAPAELASAQNCGSSYRRGNLGLALTNSRQFGRGLIRAVHGVRITLPRYNNCFHGDFGYQRNSGHFAPPLPLSAGGPHRGNGSGAHRRHQERDPQRAVFHGPFSRFSGDAGGAHRGSHGADRRRAGAQDRPRPRPETGAAGGHRKRALPPARGAGRHAAHGDEGAQAQGQRRQNGRASPPSMAWWWPRRKSCASSRTRKRSRPRKRRPDHAHSPDRHRGSAGADRRERRNRPLLHRRRGSRNRPAHPPDGPRLPGRPHLDRRGQRLLPLQHRRGGVAGPEVQGRARRNPHRGPQPHPRVRHHSSRHRRAAAWSLPSAATTC